MNQMRIKIDIVKAKMAAAIRAFPVSLFLALLLCAPVRGQEAPETVRDQYEEYRQRLSSVEEASDITACGFRLLDRQAFETTLESFGEVTFLPAMDEKYDRLVLFLAGEDGKIVYKTDQLETNSRSRGELRQPNRAIAAVSFQDMDEDGLTDIVLVTSCVNSTGEYAGKTYKVGDVLFQNEKGFYRDWRLSDKINRFSMNRNIEFITAFLRGGYSTEFLYTSTSLEELLEQGFQIIPEQCYFRQFEKLGRLQVVPGTYSMAGYDVFMIYLVNEQGSIVWSFQPMGDYDNLYALKGINCRDIDGDGLKDVVVLARYSFEGQEGGSMVEGDYEIYYQRTGGFYADTDFKRSYRCGDGDTVEALVKKARAYWGWGTQE